MVLSMGKGPMGPSDLIPKKLLFPAETPSTPYSTSSFTFVIPHSVSQPSTPKPPSSAKPVNKSPVIRYGVPQDPDVSTPQISTSAVKYGLLLDQLRDFSYSDDEEQEEDEPACFSGRNLADVSPVEHMLQDLQLRWQTEVQQTSAERASKLHDALRAADESLAQKLNLISDHVRLKQEELAKADETMAAKHLKEREQRLRELQLSHEKAAAMQQQQVQRLHAVAKAEAERKAAEERAAAEARAREDAERRQREAAEADKKRAAEEEAKRKEDADKAAATAAAALKAPAPAPKKEAGGTAAGSGTGKGTGMSRCLRATTEALEWEQAVATRFAELTDLVKAITTDDNLKKQRRDVEKKMTVHVQQVSATQDQVARKCGDVWNLILGQPDGAWRTYACLMLASKVVAQWELIMLNNKAAFPLATVVVKVSTQFPDLMTLTLGLLHKQTPLTVPRAAVTHDAASGAKLTLPQHHALMGYLELDDPARPGGKVFESEDDYMKRVEGVMLLYGAIVQVDEAANPHGLEYGWRWLARCLNALPASRATAKALIFFLRPAGYALHRRFRGQFIKLLKCMYDDFLPELVHSTESDVQSVRTLLEHYLTNGQYNAEPEGRNMPKIDMSSYQRA